jgi:hypothetical protein
LITEKQEFADGMAGGGERIEMDIKKERISACAGERRSFDSFRNRRD